MDRDQDMRTEAHSEPHPETLSGDSSFTRRGLFQRVGLVLAAAAIPSSENAAAQPANPG